MTRTVVIGGGIAGLASAALLARDGHEVTLLEQQPTVGGRAGSWERDGFRFDTGPSWYLMPEVFDHFFRLLGTSAEEQLDLRLLEPGYRVYFEGQQAPVDVVSGRERAVALFESIEPGSGAQLERYLDSAADTYEMAKRYFLYTSFASLRPLFDAPVLRRLPRLLTLLTRPLARLAAERFRDTRLQQILGYPAVFLGSSPYSAPSMYHLMSHLDLDDGVRYPMGGFAALIDRIAALTREQGVEVVTDATVTRIRTADGATTGVTWRDAGGMAHDLDADLVVSGADLHHTETKLLDADERTYPQRYWDARQPGPSALLILLGVEGKVPELEHHTLFFTDDWEGDFASILGPDPKVPLPASLYVCKPSGIDPSVAPEGHENLFVLVPIPAEPAIGRGDEDGDGDPVVEAIADRIIEQIAGWAGVPDLADRIVVRRTVGPADFARDLNAWRGTALGPSHVLSQSAFFRAGNVSKKVRGLYYVGGSTIPGIGLPMCLISAEILVKRLRGDTSTTALPDDAFARPTR